MRIDELLRVAPEQHDRAWLLNSLQAAVELELSTIPPYLCATWSIEEQQGPVFDRILLVTLDEMTHMGLMCNLINALRGTPRLNTSDVVPTYPTELPGNVHPGLTVSLQGLSKALVGDIFMRIEKPAFPPVIDAVVRLTTIGEFYDQISTALLKLADADFSDTRQLTNAAIGLEKVTTREAALAAISRIKEQGEGNIASPEGGPEDGNLAHYYKFGEIYHGREAVRGADGKWTYSGKQIPFPAVLPMVVVPSGGYPESIEFDRAYTEMLNRLQVAWVEGNNTALRDAVRTMRRLGGLARTLMQTPLPSEGVGKSPGRW